MLIPSAARSRGQMQGEKRARDKASATPTVPLVNLNLSKVLRQVVLGHSRIPFSSLKVAQKKWPMDRKDREGKMGRRKQEEQYNLCEMCQAWKEEKKKKIKKIEGRSPDEIYCALVFSNSLQY